MSAELGFKRLIEPTRIGAVELRNRIVMLPMENNYGTTDGQVTERTKRYYRERAGDVGLVLIQITCVEASAGKGYVHQLCVDDDKTLAGLSSLADTIHARGAKVFLQLHHAGANAVGTNVVAASPIPLLPGRVVPRALPVAEIKDTVARYVSAAKRAKAAGFDGVEIVASGNYLVWNFLSPSWNDRQDEYGGSLENRARLLLEIVSAVRASVGESYPVTCRLGVKEYDAANGATVADAQQVARWAQQHGLSGITVTAVGGDSVASANPGVLIPLARAMKQAVQLPVTAAGRMDLRLGERAIADGNADLVGIGRRLLADPEYVSKTLAGRDSDIKPCISCKMCIVTSLIQNEPLRCAVNPSCGKEDEYALATAAKPKNVTVVGAGPAGLSAAAIAAERGHRVTLIEESETLGGQLTLAAIPPGKSLISPLIAHLVAQVEKFGVTVKTGTSADSAAILGSSPDVVVLTTGKKDIIPAISGVELASVATAAEVLTGKRPFGTDVVVIGGELVGCETAEFMADRGSTVTIVEMLDRFMSRTSPLIAGRMLKRLRSKGVKLIPGVEREEFSDGCLIATTKSGEAHVIPADTIVYAAGGTPNDDLYRQLAGHLREIHRAGDCVEARDIAAAIEEGCTIGRAL